MGIHRGPNPVKDGLVFGYDTGYGIADNNTATRFYPGKPVTNSINGGANRANAIASPSLGSHGAAVTTELISYGNRKNVFRIYSTNTSGYYMVNQQSSIINTSGNVYTYSFDYKKIRGTSTSFSPSAIYKNGYKSPDSGSAASNLTDTIVDLEDGWKRLTRTYTSTYTGYNLYRTNLNTNDTLDFEYLFDNFMVNEGTAVPFVDGTRSSTASLIDLKRTTNIDVSNVTFDSTGQPDFDGTDDRITMPNSSVFNHTSELSIEAWVKFDGNSEDFIFEKGNVNTQYSLFSHGSDIVFRTIHAGVSGYQTLSPSKTTAGITNGQWHHIVGSWDGSTKRIYVDGVDKASVSKSGALTTNSNGAAIGSFGGTSSGYYFGGDIAIVKIYNKGLSATEVKQNYNSQKNRFDI